MTFLPDSVNISDKLISPSASMGRDSVRSLRRKKLVRNPLAVDTSGALGDSVHFLRMPDSASWAIDTTTRPVILYQPLLRKTETVNLYGTHQLTPTHRGPITKPEVAPGWLFPILMVILAVFTWLRLFYSRHFGQMLSSVFNTNLAQQIVRDENILVQRATVYLSLLYYLIAALFLYVLSLHVGWDLGFIGKGFPRFLFFTIVVSAVYAIKFLVLKFCGWLFDLDRELTIYLFNIFIINNVVGMLIFPAIVVLAFQPFVAGDWIWKSCLVLTGFFYVFRLFRGVQIGISTPGASPLYLFFYLCALELAPMLVLLRITGVVTV